MSKHVLISHHDERARHDFVLPGPDGTDGLEFSLPNIYFATPEKMAKITAYEAKCKADDTAVDMDLELDMYIDAHLPKAMATKVKNLTAGERGQILSIIFEPVKLGESEASSDS
ncbi:hypothetical protein R3P82_12615 [Dietzia maris]|uniref:Phage tail assembly protein n=1 Tax=Dietzia maris TaxID=37915 RepID=A0AAE4U5J9_9ACTN|nr:hypothetical protein [Dietzia maris]MDV6299952.1 hypothetical protein [Dietzia maris]